MYSQGMLLDLADLGASGGGCWIYAIVIVLSLFLSAVNLESVVDCRFIVLDLVGCCPFRLSLAVGSLVRCCELVRHFESQGTGAATSSAFR